MTSEFEKENREQFPLSQQDSHLDHLLMKTDLEEPWYRSIFTNIREAINPPKLPPFVVTSRPIEGAQLGNLNQLELPWYKSLVNNVRDLINPPKMAPLEVTSKPVEVGSIWGAYGGGETKSGTVSLLVHIGVIALMLIVFRKQVFTPTKAHQEFTPIILNGYKPKLPPAAQKSGGGGGGGQHMPTPVSRGVAPPKAPKSFIPPTLAVEKPKLPVAPTITAQAPVITADNYGDPLSKMMDTSGGQGKNGLGNGTGNGLGNGNGDGYGPGSGGGQGGGVYRIGGEVSQPVLISKVEPEYSEEARKAKYSGTVLLSIVVDANGMPHNIHVVRPLGLGLDEKAIEAVMKWRFRPAHKGGQSVAVQAQVEVNFRAYF